jgi:hypothetical protein
MIAPDARGGKRQRRIARAALRMRQFYPPNPENASDRRVIQRFVNNITKIPNFGPEQAKLACDTGA